MKADANDINPSDKIIRHVQNNSSRHGATPVLIVLHDTEGANLKGLADLKGLGDWFDNPTAQASAHVGVDAEGNSARYVDDDLKAWHVAFYNSVSLGVEQVGFASQKKWPEPQLHEVARWVARWSELYGIPVRVGKVTKDGRVTTSGVVRHSDLGNLGGGHHDPGDSYPFASVLALARAYLKIRKS
jgi:N-acetyl-anhydromuramyl-L-alanine amidase AmpD